MFLSAEWRHLLMLNYEVDPGILQPFVPSGTQLDSFQSKTYVSLVGFRFCRTKLRGRLRVPFHSEFEEINLRFYVCRLVNGEIRRGVVFIAEIVPKLAIAKTARWVYGENYVCRSMAHRLQSESAGNSVEYAWQDAAGRCAARACTTGTACLPAEGSIQQFITEHYWGYSLQKAGGTLEYHVAHPPWRIWNTSWAEFAGDPSDLYGKELAQTLLSPPDSAFVAEGSEVRVSKGVPVQ